MGENHPSTRRAGRPAILLTDEVRAAIVECVRNGCPYTVAAKCAGISPRTLQTWLQRGRDGSAPEYVALVADIEKAKSEAIRVAVEEIRAAGKKNWTAFAWWLERTYPGMYSKDNYRIREVERELAELSKLLRGSAPPVLRLEPRHEAQ